MATLSDLPNIGAILEKQLNAVRVFTGEELRTLGSRETWLRIQHIDSSACIHRLLALEGAVRGVRKTLLPPDVKDELREFYRQHKI